MVKSSAAVAAILRKQQSVRLDLGCGPNKQDGFVGIDARKLPGVDIVHDLETFPWPLPDSCASVVVLSHVWEHVSPKVTMRFMEELHRVCRDGAQVMIAGPYGNGFRFVQDPTHCNPSNEGTFLYWDNRHGLWHVYRPSVFHLESFDRVPVGGGIDFNAVLKCCKQKQCHHTST